MLHSAWEGYAHSVSPRERPLYPSNGLQHGNGLIAYASTDGFTFTLRPVALGVPADAC